MNTQSKIDWRQVILPSVIALIFFTVVTGMVYPLTVTGIAQVFFSHQANGSLITDSAGNTIGSELIG
ncbi:MAG TPA: potassium-transporting ATPase subunit C, partial [Phototrophicaceae bacterium]|nr:potassium-transporting ATPase subunit C [Phototrophicaceae bacterium]